MKFFARFVSLLFNPIVFFLIMPFLVVYRQTQSSTYALKWQIFSSIFLFLGLVLFVVGRIKGAFSDEDVSKREERYKFYILLYILGFAYFLIAILLKGAFFPLSIITFGIILGILVFNFVNRFIKASIHVAVSVAFVITIGFLYGWIYLFLILWIVPLTFWARIVSKRHTAKEAIIGAILEVIITLTTALIGKLFYNY